MSASAIRAGEAFVEVTIRDKLTQGINRAVAKLSVFAKTVKSLSVSEGLTGTGSALAKIGAVLAGAGGGITAVMAKSVSVFMEVAKYAKEIGNSIGAIDAAKAVKLTESWETLKAVLGAVQFFVGSALAAPLTELMNVAIGLGVELAKWIKNNQQIVVTIAAIGAIALVAGTAIVALGGAFVAAGGALSMVVTAITALLTPVGAVIALMVAVGAAVLIAAGAFIGFSEIGQEAIGGIVASLATGDITTAWKIICKAMEVMWDAVWVSIKSAMMAAFSFIFQQITAAVTKLANMVGGVEVALGVLSGKKLDFGSGALHGAAGALGGLGAVVGAGQRADFDKTITELLGDLAGLAGMSEAKKKEFALKLSGLGAFNHAVGGELGGGSSVGTFSGKGAGLLGVGPGGGQKVTDDKTHDILERVIKAIKGIDVMAEFK